jgi:hypothetical protein
MHKFTPLTKHIVTSKEINDAISHIQSLFTKTHSQYIFSESVIVLSTLQYIGRRASLKCYDVNLPVRYHNVIIVTIGVVIIIDSMFYIFKNYRYYILVTWSNPI